MSKLRSPFFVHNGLFSFGALPCLPKNFFPVFCVRVGLEWGGEVARNSPVEINFATFKVRHFFCYSALSYFFFLEVRDPRRS